MNYIGNERCTKIDIHQIFCIRSITDNMRTFNPGWETYSITDFHGFVAIGSTDDANTTDNIENLFVHFVIMITVGKIARCNANQVGTAYTNIISETWRN